MKLIPKILVSFLIFLITLGFLLHVKKLLSADPGPGTIMKLKVIKEGDKSRFPDVRDLFLYPGAEAKLELSDKFGFISETSYSINDYGLRNPVSTGTKKQHLLLSGCSFVFGFGLNYDDTMTALLRKKLPEINVQNISFPHGGLHTSLRYFEIVNPTLFTPEEEGVFVHVMIADQLNRFLLRPEYLVRDVEKAPAYQVRDGKVSYRGKAVDTPESGFVTFMKTFGLEKFLYTPRQFKDDELEKFVLGVSELKARYLSSFPRGKFIWVIHPISGGNAGLFTRLKNLADKKNIEIYTAVPDFHQFLKKSGTPVRDHYNRREPHPSRKNNEFFTGWLTSKLYGKS